MDDLISKYFRADLTEAEEKTVADVLLSSPEEALRLRDLAEARYRSYGLPDPTRMGGPPPAGPSAGKNIPAGPWMMSVVLLGFLGGMAGLGTYMVRSRGTLPPSGVTLTGEGPSQKGTDPSGQATGAGQSNGALPPLSTGDPDSTDAPSAPPKVPSQAKSFPPPGSASAHGWTPQLASSLAPGDYSNLGVLVQQAIEGPVSVLVLDGAGRRKMVIFQGNLKPGEWVFNWDGHYPDGRLLEEGFYEVEVASGSVTQKRRISITAP